MMCTVSEFWWVFLAVAVISAFVLTGVPSEALKAGCIAGAICLLSVVLMFIAVGAYSDSRCREMRYQAVLERRTELVRECPDSEKYNCPLKWIRYQKDSLDAYHRVLQ